MTKQSRIAFLVSPECEDLEPIWCCSRLEANYISERFFYRFCVVSSVERVEMSDEEFSATFAFDEVAQ